MRTIVTCCLLGGLLVASSGCQKGNESPEASSESCGPEQPPVKTVKDVEGTIGFHPALQQYYIRRAVPGTHDAVDFGVLCEPVPASLQGVGNKVVFSGTYKPYDRPSPAVLGGHTFYYLGVSRVTVPPRPE